MADFALRHGTQRAGATRCVRQQFISRAENLAYGRRELVSSVGYGRSTSIGLGFSVGGGAPRSPATVDRRAPTIANPSFETPAQGSGYTYNPTGASWTFTGSSGIQGNGSAWGGLAAADGTQTAFLQSANNSVISQTLDFTDTGTFVLVFDSAQRPGNDQTLAVELDGNTLATYTPPSSTTWTTYATSIVVTAAGDHTIAFEGLNGSGDNSVFIDEVSLIVPTPPTVATPAAADPASLNGTFTNLSVLARTRVANPI